MQFQRRFLGGVLSAAFVDGAGAQGSSEAPAGEVVEGAGHERDDRRHCEVSACPARD